jgi:hypothetical protein
MMVFMESAETPPPADLWAALEISLADHRNRGYENSDHPDDFTAPTGSDDDD